MKALLILVLPFHCLVVLVGGELVRMVVALALVFGRVLVRRGVHGLVVGCFGVEVGTIHKLQKQI